MSNTLLNASFTTKMGNTGHVLRTKARKLGLLMITEKVDWGKNTLKGRSSKCMKEML